MKYKTPEEIRHLNIMERELRPDEIDKRCQRIITDLNNKKELIPNYDHKALINFSIKNLIKLVNNEMIDIEDFTNRVERLIGYRLVFEQLKTQDNDK